MSRPLKDGLDYFSLDTNFFQDKKVQLLKSEFGVKSVAVLISLFCEIYRENGYFKNWDNDDCLLMAEALAGGCDSDYISQVVHGCLRRSLFDNKVFKVFGILTSAGIQRRYIRAMSKREEIAIINEYWLLDVNDKKDVPASVRNKVVFKAVSVPRNPNKRGNNPNKNTSNPQSKVKERKDLDVDDLQDSELARAHARAAENPVETGGKVENGTLPTLDGYFGMTAELKQQAQSYAETLFSEFFGRKPVPEDVRQAFQHVRYSARQPDGSWDTGIDADKSGMLCYAFRTAQRAGQFRWEYVEGVLARCIQRGLKTLDDCERYDARRDYEKDNRR